MTATDAMAGESYAEWIRRTLVRMRASGGRIMPLFDSSVAEPRDLLADLVSRAFAAPVTDRYASAFAGGNPFVVERLAASYGVAADGVICTTGATGALSLLYQAMVRPGERVLVETPGFDLFAGIATLHGIGVDTFARIAPEFTLDVDAVAAALTPQTRLVVLSNLHNPSGAPVVHEAMVALARLSEARDVVTIVDEVYGDYADAVTRPLPAARLSPNMVSVSSLTKIFGLSTLRCGWIVGDPAVLAPVRAIADRFEFGISNLSHAVAALVLDDPAPFRRWSDDSIAAAKPLAAAAFARWQAEGLIDGGLPEFGCIAFPRLPGIDDTATFAQWLALRGGVVVAPGEYFGAPGHVRIGFARSPAELAFALDALDEGLRAYRQVAAVA